MINNNICKLCDHALVCETFGKKISIFDAEAKKDLKIELTLNKCENFTPIRDLEEE